MKRKLEDTELIKEFVLIVGDILRTEEFERMKKYKHHVKGSLYAHSVKVAFLCFKHHKRFRLKTDIEAFVQGALLHDYYLYDLHSEEGLHRFHWFNHPKIALKNALIKYPHLTCVQKDMIKRHMFPLTPVPPATKEGWLLCFYDKVAAISDRLGKNRRISDLVVKLNKRLIF